DDATNTPKNAETLITMFTKQSAIMEKYTQHLESLEKETLQPEPVEAVTAMVEQTHIQTEAMLNAVEREEEDFPEELQQQLEGVLLRTEETLEGLMERLKRKKGMGGDGLGKATASGKETASGGQATTGSLESEA
ncbi:MAG: hypothetical protein Q9224_006899, partial [Gallowayella concinna]